MVTHTAEVLDGKQKTREDDAPESWRFAIEMLSLRNGGSDVHDSQSSETSMDDDA